MEKRIFLSVVTFLSICTFSFGNDGWQSLTVEKTFDNRPFNYVEKPTAVRPGYKILRLKYPSPTVTALEQNNTIPADYYLPDGIRPGDPKRPAVICLHILDGNDPLTEIVCTALAARGIPALAFKLPYYGERGLADGPMAMAKDPKLLVSALEQTAGDVRRTVDLLASRPEIAPDKIDITGISLGGIVAASAAGEEPRIHRAALMLAGGDLMTIIHHAEETKPLSKTLKAMPDAEQVALEAKIEATDPLRFAASLRDRARKGQVLMINAMEDEVIPKQCTEKLADAMAIPDKIVWIDGLGHYTAMAELPASLKMITDFFARDLPPGVTPPSTASRTSEMKTLAEIFQQMATALAVKPEPGKCYSVSLKYAFEIQKQYSLEGEFRCSRDSQDHFALSCKLPLVGPVSLGQGEYPWMVSGDTVLCGANHSTPGLKNPREFLGKPPIQFFRMMAGLFQCVAQNPEVLMRYIDAMAVQPGELGERKLTILGKDHVFNEVTMGFGANARMPSNVAIQGENFSGSIRILDWQTGVESRPELFAPPANLQMKKVDQSEVYQMFETLRTMLRMAGGK
jgi:dienelactone hydrolase